MADGTTPIWHLAKGNQKIGEFTSPQLAEMGLQGRITSDMKVWKSGMSDWQPASKVKGLRVTPALDEPPPLVADRPASTAVSPGPQSPTVVTGHVTIEKTSKQIKQEILLSLGVLAFGLLLLAFGGLRLSMLPAISGEEIRLLTGEQRDAIDNARGIGVVAAFIGCLCAVTGFGALIYAWLKAWWEHG